MPGVDGAVPVGQLARDVLAKQPTVTKLVQRMADEGLLVLRADPAGPSLAPWWRPAKAG
ncbi:MAG: MarR family transcriptional regulator [Comamonadaceae bacterium]|nr:MarR family transcriptional regulator [Comamonadaceae bacterium]